MHIHPAVSVGLAAAGRFRWAELPAYVIALVLGAITASSVLLVIASGKAGFNVHAGFAYNGYGAHSPGGYSLLACFVCEIVMTFFFLMVILGSTHERAPKGFAPIAIGLSLTLIHPISIPVTNTSVNPARSTGPALFAGGWASQQLWFFWLAPMVGAISAGLVHHALFEKAPPEPLIAGDIHLRAHTLRAPVPQRIQAPERQKVYGRFLTAS